MKRILMAGVLAALASPGATAAEKLRHDAEPPPDEHYFERNRAAKLERWSLPQYPTNLTEEPRLARVKVCLTVDERGEVADPEIVNGDERFSEAALAAVRQWRFQPAMEDGKPVARSLQTTLVFSRNPSAIAKMAAASEPPFTFEDSPMIPPGEGHSPDPVYPRHLVKRALAGEVEMLIGLGKDGHVRGVQVVRTTHADFLSAAFAAVEQWQLAPARRGRLPVEGEKVAQLTFRVMDTETQHTSHEEWLEQNGIRLADPGASAPRLYFDRIPEAVNFVDPVYPAELREKGVTGEASVDFSVDQSGAVVAATVREASEEAFGAALLAAVSAWRFNPLYHGGEAVWVDFQVKWRFEQPNEKNTLPENLAALAPDTPRASARQLDGRIEPIHISAAELPPGETEGGTAEVEIIINQNGRACWPRIVKADRPTVGWAAATAVSQWYFATPRKNGQPVAVRVIVPVEIPPVRR